MGVTTPATTQDSLSPYPLAQALVEQLQRHHGCPPEAHCSSGSPSSDSVSLSEMMGWECPDILAQANIARHPTPWGTRLPPEQRQRLYSGITLSTRTQGNPDHAESGPVLPPSPPTVDLESDTIPIDDLLQAHFDIDSAGGFASSLAVAREGFQWKAGRPSTSNLQGSLHLELIPVQWEDAKTGRLRQSRRPVHRIPHLPFGRLAGFPDMEVYLLFPRLFQPHRQHWVITKEEYALWIDRVFLPALHLTLPSSALLHIPSSAAHIEVNSTAARVEGHVQTQHEQPRIQEFHFSLQPHTLQALWVEVEKSIDEQGLWQFYGVQLLMTAKNLKLSSQRPTWSDMRDTFFLRWNRAVDAQYLTQDFFDIAKEVVSPWSFLSHQEPSHTPLTLTWRRCCLDGFGKWLAGSEAATDTASELDDDAVPPVRRSGRRQHATTGSPLSNTNPAVVRDSPAAGEDIPYETEDDEESEGVSSRETSGDESPSPSGPSIAWRTEFYPLSFLRDMGSITLEPYRSSPLWKRGLRYCQLYNTSKDILAAGKHYPFNNENLDTLALDPGLVRTWQHVGGAISHSPLALLRAYLHTKQRCHIALADCRHRSYGTREEYRVTGTVLVEMDQILRQANQADQPLLVPTTPMPFFSHRTDQILAWLRWNINKLCTGFEMTYSLQPRTVVHWEHTRVMMMFLQCLLRGYGGQGHHLRRSNGLWLDRRVGRPRDGSDTEQIQEGMGMAITMARYGYAWFSDKLDWAAMTFRPPYRAHMSFNTPSLQSAYHARYWQLVQTKTDFLLFHDVFTRMRDLRADFAQSALLLQLLVQLCLRAFRKDVWTALADLSTRQPLHPTHLQAACAGDIPLTLKGIRQVFRHSYFQGDLVFVSGSKMKVTHVEVFFAWLWGWDGDGNNGDWPRKHWEFKPYRILYRQCFGIIAQVYGMQQAREWRTIVKQTWIRTHWILPYPNTALFWSRGGGRKLQTWASIHPELEQYYQEHQPGHGGTLQPYEVEELPITGWVRGNSPGALDVELPPIPTDLDAWLARAAEQPTAPALEIPLPAIGVRDGDLSRYLHATVPEYRVLRSFMQEKQQSLSKLHADPEWVSKHLVYHTRALIEAQQQQVRSLDSPPAMRSWQARPRPNVSRGLSSLNPTMSTMDLEEDSDPDNLKTQQERLARRLGRMQQRLRMAQAEAHRFLQCRTIMKQVHQEARAPQKPMTPKRWEADVATFRKARKRSQEAATRLARISQQTTAHLEDHSVAGP